MEARDFIGLPVTFAEGELESALWDLFDSYDTALRFGKAVKFPPASTLRGASAPIELEAAAIESAERLDTFTFEGTVTAAAARKGGEPDHEVEITDRQWRKR